MSRFQSGQALASSYVDEHRVQALQFGILSPETIQQMSVAEIKSTQIYDQTTFMPNFHAINDPRLGVTEKDARCLTCKAGVDMCPGHFGHITLNEPVYHAGLLTYLTKYLKMVCFNCSRLLACNQSGEGQVANTVNALKNIEERDKLMKVKSNKARFRKMLSLAEQVSICNPELGGCGYKQPKYRKGALRIDIEYQDDNFDNTRDRKETLWPDQALKVLERISEEDLKLMGSDPRMGRPDWAILRVLAVAPPPVRPSVLMTSTMRSEDDLTYAYQQVIKMNNILREQREKGANQTIINELRTSLQYFVATLMDNDIAGQPTQKHKSGKPIKSIRSRLKGKEGRLRGNLMGKRVDFSARTVITPDPSLALDELGVPLSVATGLTIPETITAQNIGKMRQLVSNGPSVWPGAKYIIRHDDRYIDLSMLRNRSDLHIEIGYKVERHLQDGDYVCLNRQPSLHKMSIMGHRVKVLPFSTFRLNLSVTTPYNADFDGDEMNIHVPQSYESMAETKEIMSVPAQILTPQSNKPCMGLVQDTLLGCMLLTQRDTFLTKEEAMQLYMWVPEQQAFGHQPIQLPQPAIIKPKPLWTGKQLFSLLIPSINLEKEKNKAQAFNCPKDSNVLIQRGELVQGFLTKAMCGPTGQGIAHVITKECGPARCAEFLTTAQYLVNNWLITCGFTVGVQDIIINKTSVSQSISNTLSSYKRKVSAIVQKSQLGKLKSQPGKSMLESFEAQVNKRLNDARDKSGNLALDGLSQANRLINMVTAGSKGSNINISQIMGCVGQQNVEGKRIPFGFNHRTLPHFSKDDFGPESKGFVESSYLIGLSPSELYFHAMGGREGLIDTAVKTAETGYISRRLIKALEDVMVQYDGTVRTSRHNLLQFVYGEDGMAGEHLEDLSIDLLKSSDQQLKSQCMFVPRGQSQKADNKLQDAVTDNVFASFTNDPQQQDLIEGEFRNILADRQMLRHEIFKTTTEDQIHLPVNVVRLIQNAKGQFGIQPNSRSDLQPSTVITQVSKLLSELNVLPGAKMDQNKLLVEADLNARRLFNIYIRHQLCSKNVIMNERMSAPSFEWLLGEIKSRFDSSIVHAGEMVGSVAAQSLGEPATQMTLNTFHFAGISAKNVTLGVPRFKEIINVSSNIKTPGLKIFLKDKYKKKESKVSKLGMLIEYTTLSHVVSESAIYYDPDMTKTVIPEDEGLVQLYNEVPVLEEANQQAKSPWLLRFELDRDKLVHKGLTMALIDKKLTETFQDQIHIMVSDENSERHVVRVRINNIEDDPEETVASYLKNEFEPLILNHLALKGLPEIAKVTFTKHQDHYYCSESGRVKFSEDNWVIETDGSALAKILCLKKVDHTRTVSNDNLEVLNVLGCEAARQSLINELRFVFSSYGIYVNYRHISTLIDVMTHRGKLTSITRHGINRLESSGPLRKCSFEETVEILLEGAIFSEKDLLTGISENVIMGQLGPFGTGSFSLALDGSVVEQHSQKNYQTLDMMESEYEEDTPMVDGKGYATPTIGMTPKIDFPGSAYSGGSDMTPGIGGQTGNQINFSPMPFVAGGAFESPQIFQSPSPYYNGQSPQYAARVGSAQYASPIYQNSSRINPLQQSPIYTNGPSHLATSGNKSFVSPIYKQEGGIGAQSNYSPAYCAPVSPQYGQSGVPMSKMAGTYQSPNYSPSACVMSPHYSHTNQGTGEQKSKMAVYSPNYSPASLQQKHALSSEHSSANKDGLVQSPVYQPPSFHATSVKQEAGVSPQYTSQINTVVVQSPVYNPASPQYGNTRRVQSTIKEESDESD